VEVLTRRLLDRRCLPLRFSAEPLPYRQLIVSAQATAQHEGRGEILPFFSSFCRRRSHDSLGRLPLRFLLSSYSITPKERAGLSIFLMWHRLLRNPPSSRQQDFCTTLCFVPMCVSRRSRQRAQYPARCRPQTQILLAGFRFCP